MDALATVGAIEWALVLVDGQGVIAGPLVIAINTQVPETWKRLIFSQPSSRPQAPADLTAVGRASIN